MCLFKLDRPKLVGFEERGPSHSPFKDDNELALILGHSPLRVLAFRLFHIKFLSLSILLFPSHTVWVTYEPTFSAGIFLIVMLWSTKPDWGYCSMLFRIVFLHCFILLVSLCKLQRKLPVISSHYSDSSFPIVVVLVVCSAPGFILVNVHYITNFRV